MNTLIAILVVTAVLIPHLAQPMVAVESSPEPQPMSNEPGLYLVTAGLESRVISPLKEGMTICNADYPTGISILCVSDARLATFFVNAVQVRREFRHPFYLSGDTFGRVGVWKKPPVSAAIRCAPKNRKAFRTTVQFKC